MVEIMYEVFGIGLVVIQVDVYKQVVVIDILEEKNDLCVFVNLCLESWVGFQIGEEGCFLVLGIYDKVEWVEWVIVYYFDFEGKV